MLNMRNHVRVRRFFWKPRYLRIARVTGDQSRLISLRFCRRSVINRESIIWSPHLQCIRWRRQSKTRLQLLRVEGRRHSDGGAKNSFIFHTLPITHTCHPSHPQEINIGVRLKPNITQGKTNTFQSAKFYEQFHFPVFLHECAHIL